jgi:hypothetical protein
MVAFQLQWTNPSLLCSVLDVTLALNGKKTHDVVNKLLELRDIMIFTSGFDVVELVFDGDSYFKPIHSEFEQVWP